MNNLLTKDLLNSLSLILNLLVVNYAKLQIFNLLLNKYENCYVISLMFWLINQIKKIILVNFEKYHSQIFF